jgi:DNA-directed RNA polymerase specialized sigma24 family protein
MREETLINGLIRHKRVFEALLLQKTGDDATASELFEEMVTVMSRARRDVEEHADFVAWGRTVAQAVVREYERRLLRSEAP